MSIALLAGIVLVGAGMPLAALRRATPAIAAQVAGALLVAAAAVAVVTTGGHAGASFSDAIAPRFGADGLTAFFALVVCGAAVPALLFALDGLAGVPARRTLTALTSAFLLSLLGVLLARDVTTFLGFWELMTLVPATAILVGRRDAQARRAVFVYLAITHVGGAGVWVAMLTLAHHGALAGAGHGAPQALVIAAALVGFGTKAGVMPLHVWLPRAHPAAPSHVSALMSGVMVKVALYGLIRVLFDWAAPAPRWAGLVMLGAGALSAAAGILYALVQRELKRLLAFSTVENVGVIVAALGAAVLLFAAGEPAWGTLAFAAALLHTINHAAFKVVLFLGAGAFGSAAGGTALDRLGGLLRRMPWTGWAFAAGCAAIAGVPPLNGFVSEWLALQSVLHVGLGSAPGIAVAGTLATAALASAAALALFCFVKVAGLTLLGPARTAEAAAARERPAATRAAMALAAAACLALAAIPGVLVPRLAALAPGAVAPAPGAGLDLPGTGGLPSLGLLLALALVFTVVMRAKGGAGSAAPAPAWSCGQPLEPALAWTSAGFTKPLRLVLESILRPRRDFDLAETPGGVERIRYRAEVPHLFDDLVYGPAQRAALRGALVARRLQSGSLRAYVLYLLGLVLGLLTLLRLGGLT